MKPKIMAALLLLGGCQEEAPLPEPISAAAPIPEETCEQAAAGLEKLKEAGAIAILNGEVAMEQESWLAIGRVQQDQLITALAVKRGCEAKDAGPEQEVVIRNEGGQVITRRTVSIGPDIGALVGE